MTASAVPQGRMLPSQSIASALRARLANAGWIHQRAPLAGREEWTEPTLTAGRRYLRTVRVDELPGEPDGRVVEGFNGHERLVLRVVGDTEPVMVLVTLDLWQMLPAETAAPTTPARRDPDPISGAGVATTGGPATTHAAGAPR